MPYLDRGPVYLEMENEEVSPPITVVDVYDMASDIGKEFEKLIDACGAEQLTSLMPKVVAALEHLESFAARADREMSHLTELQTTIARLENDKLGKAGDRKRFEKELEQLEDSWREESKDLLDLVAKLKEENRRLDSLLQEKEEIPKHACSHEQDLKVLHRMKEVIDQQRDQLRAKDKELDQDSNEIEAIQGQLDRMTQLNKELRRKQKASQFQTRLLIDEKAELQAQLQEQTRAFQVLKQTLGITQKDKEDLARAKSADSIDLRNKVVYDLDDPDRPKFTMSELKSILFERNELKAKVSELEDELDFYRPKPQQPDSCDDDDAPVQGPINKEPDDAPWRKQESGIRKFFRILFGETPENVRKSLSRGRLVTSVPEPYSMLQ